MAIKIIKKRNVPVTTGPKNQGMPHSLMKLKGMVAAKPKAKPGPASVATTKSASLASAPAKPMRRDKRERHERLCKLIIGTIAGELPGGKTIDFEEFVWAVRPLPEWTALLGIKNVDTVSDLIKVAPIRKNYTQVDGVKALLLRVGEPGPVTPRMTANLMRSMFLKRTGRNPKPAEFPLLKVLAEEWPDQLQIEIFKAVLDDWPAFKTGVANAIEMMKWKGEKAFHRFHQFPSVSVICRFRDVAEEWYLMQVQEKAAQGKPVPAAVIAAYPDLFSYLGKA